MEQRSRNAFTLVSPLDPGEARGRLAAAIGTPRWTSTYDESRPFTGRIDGSSFDVMRTTRGRNSFRPRIRGTIEAASGGSRINGTMRLHDVVMVFLALLVLGPMWVFAQLVADALRTGRWDPRIFVIPAVVLGLMTMIGLAFTHERRRAMRELTDLLDGRG